MSATYEAHLERIIAKCAAADVVRVKYLMCFTVTVGEVFDQWKADAFPALWHRHIKLKRFHVGDFKSLTFRDAFKREFFSIIIGIRRAIA